jgi:hypothetical protein
MDTPGLFPGEHVVREEAAQAGWTPSTGNGWAAVFVSPEGDSVTLMAYPSFIEAGVRPAFLLVETSMATRRGPRWGCRSGSPRRTSGSPHPRRPGFFWASMASCAGPRRARKVRP